MTLSIPSYFRSSDVNQNRRTDEQDQYNREVARQLQATEGLFGVVFGSTDLFQFKEFQFNKTGGSTEEARFRHDFGKIVTEYQILNVQGTSGGGAAVNWPGRVAEVFPTAGVDDNTFVTLEFDDRGLYILRFIFSDRLAAAIPTLPGPS